jgi:flagellar motor switch protein FliM
MADILSQEEIDALLDVCEEGSIEKNVEAKLNVDGHIHKLEELLNPMVEISRSELTEILWLLKEGNKRNKPNFSEILKDEFASTIEGLTGILPQISIIQGYTLNELMKEKQKNLLIISHKADFGKFHFMFDQNLASNLSDVMLGGEGDYAGDVLAEDDNIDAMKEITSNIMGATFNTICQKTSEIKSLDSIEKHERVKAFVFTLGKENLGVNPLEDGTIYQCGLLSFVFTFNDINTRIDIIYPNEYQYLSLS